jgi:hypothetical protein
MPAGWIAAGSALSRRVRRPMSRGRRQACAAHAQSASAQAGIDEQRRQFDAGAEAAEPVCHGRHRRARRAADLLGLNGSAAQQRRSPRSRSGPQFQAMLAAGENSILAERVGYRRAARRQHAGRARAVLAALLSTHPAAVREPGRADKHRPERGGRCGQRGAATGQGIAGLLGQQGAAQAGGYLAQGQASAGYASAIGNGFGTYAGLGGFRTSPGFSYDTSNTYNPSAAMGGGGFGYKGGGSGF